MPMMIAGDGLSAPVLAGASLLIISVAIAAHFLPAEIGRLVVAWVVLSVPLGIAVGHCALSEK